MTRLTKKEKLIAGVFDFKKSLTEEEKIDIKETAKNRLNRVLLEGVIYEIVNVDEITFTKEDIKLVVETLFDTKVIEVYEKTEGYNGTMYIVTDTRFKHIEILIFDDRKVCVNPFWE